MTHAFGPVQTSPTNGVWHPYANLFPMIDGQAFEDLKADIAANGVLEPVTILDGQILDGRNRHFAAGFVHAACPWREYQGDDPLGFVISQNLKRRHLTESQRAMVAGKLAKMPAHRPAADNPANLPTSVTQSEAAEALNVSERSVRTAKAVERDAAPEITAMVESGALSLNAAAEASKLPLEEQAEAAQSGPEAVKDAVKRNRRGAVGTIAAPASERGDDLYETPEEAIRCLLMLERFTGTVWEPACGPGAIMSVLKAGGHDVVASDLRDYGHAGQHVGDFMEAVNLAPGCDIVTNPPYGIADKFVSRAVLEMNAPKVAMLLRLQFLAGCNDLRSSIMDAPRKPARVHVFTRRLPMMHRNGWDGPVASSQQDHAWFVWDRASHGPTIINRVDWKALLS